MTAARNTAVNTRSGKRFDQSVMQAMACVRRRSTLKVRKDGLHDTLGSGKAKATSMAGQLMRCIRPTLR